MERTSKQPVAVVGASGFVGSWTWQALERQGCTVIPVPAPRLAPRPLERARELSEKDLDQLSRLRNGLQGAERMINCAGLPAATSGAVDELVAANAVLPLLLAHATAEFGLVRFVQVSSAAVQGRRPVSDATLEYDEFSPYAASKAAGERSVLATAPAQAVIYRPHGVHAPGREVTASLTKFASSRLARIVSPGDRPTPQAHAANVGSAIAFLATLETQPPSVVTHPWEGLTTSSLLESLSGRPPRQIPATVATLVLGMARAASRLRPGSEGHVRRLEMLWFGQRQAPSWLTEVGWQPHEHL